MHRSRLRSLMALVASAALLASLSVATVATPASAAKPKCFGQTATIVGTQRADVIRGTAKRDVIVAKGGADRIFGRGGNDLICAGDGNDRVVGNAGIDKLIGGRGADRMFGGTGPDRLFGGPGPDTIAGQPGNDVIDGGLGVDTCYQGLGSGPVVNCELPVAPLPPPPPPTADLGVLVVCPNPFDQPGDMTCTVTVTNYGPDASAYTLQVGESTYSGPGANCYPLFDDSAIAFPSLAPNSARAGDYIVHCDPSSGSQELVGAEVVAAVPDPVPGNNTYEVVVDLI